MQLAKALRLGAAPRLAFSGSGGKTTALFQTARELASRQAGATVLVTATTHLADEQLKLADYAYSLVRPGELQAVSAALPPGVVLLTGPQAGDGRMASVEPGILEGIFHLAGQRGLPLLIEADGSRRRPLKAPAEHEPVIPVWVDTVVVVAGLSGLGQPLAEEWVHRPDRFAALSGGKPGEPVTVEMLARVLAHPQGGLHHIPAMARRISLLNQADSIERQSAGRRLAATLQEAYQAVVLAALRPEAVEPADAAQTGAPVFAVYEPAAGVVLAAGAANRLGRPKQLLPWHGEPFVRVVARIALEAGLSPVVVLVGAFGDEVRSALAGLPVSIVENPDWQAGLSTSVAAGVRALPESCGAALFLLADKPQIPVTLLRSLVELHATTLCPLVAPQADGQRANPTLFDRSVFQELLQVRGDSGGRELFSRHPVTWLPWHDPGILLDVDTEQDLQKLRQHYPDSGKE